MDFKPLEAQIHMTLDAISNGEPIEFKDEWIEEAGETFKECLRNRLTERDTRFRLRASNLGRPLCQLQMQKFDSPSKRQDYSFATKMFIGDAVETFMSVIFKIAKTNITGEKKRVSMDIGPVTIEGEDDIEFDNAVWDVKTCSDYAFHHKWAGGWDSVYHTDTFGYVTQLWVYAKSQNKPMGGWIVINKSTGEVVVVPAEPTPEQLKHIEEQAEDVVDAITTDRPFERVFEPEPEFYRKQPTGNTLLPKVCTFCDFQHHCWPNAVLKPKARSTAKNPQPVWYIDHHEET